MNISTLVTWHEHEDKLNGEAEHDHPDVDEGCPVVVLKCSRIFQPKDECVSDHRDAVQEQHNLKLSEKEAL